VEKPNVEMKALLTPDQDARPVVPTSCPTVYEQLCELNKYWRHHEVAAPILRKRICFDEHTDLIQLHLRLVEEFLREQPMNELTAEQRTKRQEGLDILRTYWQAGKFPINNHHPGQIVPYFIDDFGTACAVGHIVRETGYEAFAEKVQQENNYAYIEDMDYPELTVWAEAYGFDEMELRWIQPGYFNPCPTVYGSFVQDFQGFSTPAPLYQPC
jgi:hypothetical protein